MKQFTTKKASFIATTTTPILLDVSGAGAVGIQLFGTFSGTVTFEASIDGENFVVLNMRPSNSATEASTATAPGAFTVNCAGYKTFRARCTTYVSGQIDAVASVAEAAGR